MHTNDFKIKCTFIVHTIQTNGAQCYWPCNLDFKCFDICFEGHLMLHTIYFESETSIMMEQKKMQLFSEFKGEQNVFDLELEP